MFGVVLWSDQQQNRAVIWCEDHGDLAFFNGDRDGCDHGIQFDPGDLVQFDLDEERHMRMARNPRLVMSEEYPTLTNDLKTAGEQTIKVSVPVKAPPVESGHAKIIAFEPRSAAARHRSRPSRQVI